MSEVTRADESDAGVPGQVIADAFFDLPPSLWLIPDPDARRAIFPGYFQLVVEQALASGVVHTTPDRAAAALWRNRAAVAVRVRAEFGSGKVLVGGRHPGRWQVRGDIVQEQRADCAMTASSRSGLAMTSVCATAATPRPAIDAEPI